MSLQYWDKEESQPTVTEVLEELESVLLVLSSALPLALRVVGSRPIHEQVGFWKDLVPFDVKNDLLTGDLTDLRVWEDIESILMDWAQYVCALKGKSLEK